MIAQEGKTLYPNSTGGSADESLKTSLHIGASSDTQVGYITVDNSDPDCSVFSWTPATTNIAYITFPTKREIVISSSSSEVTFTTRSEYRIFSTSFLEASMKDGKIKVNRDTTKIQVNDEGDFIEIDFNNQSFVENIIKIYDYSKNKRPKFDNSSNFSIEKISSLFKYNDEILNLINKTFGENSVIKIFGIEHPAEDLILDFIIQLKPYIEKVIEEKKKKVEVQQKEYQKRASSRESVRYGHSRRRNFVPFC